MGMTYQEIADKADWEGGYMAFAEWAGRTGLERHVNDPILRDAFVALLDAHDRISSILPEPDEEVADDAM